MKEGQENIYYLSGTDLKTLRNNPQLEGFEARQIPVLLLTDPIDEFWVQTFTEYQGKKIVSVMHAKNDLDKIAVSSSDTKNKLSEKEADKLLKRIKEILGDKIQSVELTDRLTKSPLSLITPEGQMSLHLERLMKANGQQIAYNSERIVQVNPKHPLIHKLAELINTNGNTQQIDNAIWVLYDQTLIAEGEALSDPALFSSRLNEFILSGLSVL